MGAQAVAACPWAARRRRAAELKQRWPFTAEVLTFYDALLAAQEQVYAAARAEVSDASRAVPFAVARALPLVRAVTIASGPGKLARAVADPPAKGGGVSTAPWEDKVRRWLDGGELSAVERYLARAAAGPVLEALGPASGRVCGGRRDARHCPDCGGLPQTSLLVPAGEDLVAPRRYLECSRCSRRWPYPRLTCAGCGEAEARDLPIFAEEGTAEAEATGAVIRGLGAAPAGAPALSSRFPHVSIHACRTCARYLLNIDLGRDARAVPVVDEIAAIPLDLYAAEQGVTKITPNLMGF